MLHVQVPLNGRGSVSRLKCTRPTANRDREGADSCIFPQPLSPDKLQPMQLAFSTRVGHYEVLALLGEGGMGEVYRARDTQLGREVALKILPAGFAHDPDRMARFEREAKVLASLNHPNIAAIYGMVEHDGLRGIVMELVEGPTLAERIAQGPIPLDE